MRGALETMALAPKKILNAAVPEYPRKYSLISVPLQSKQRGGSNEALYSPTCYLIKYWYDHVILFLHDAWLLSRPNGCVNRRFGPARGGVRGERQTRFSLLDRYPKALRKPSCAPAPNVAGLSGIQAATSRCVGWPTSLTNQPGSGPLS